MATVRAVGTKQHAHFRSEHILEHCRQPGIRGKPLMGMVVCRLALR